MKNSPESLLSQTDTEMTALFRLYKDTQDITLRDKLVCRHLHLVHSVARRFSGLGESLDDLIQEGTIGLLKAVDVFDAERGVKFSTYSCHLITSQIQHYLRDRGRIIRQPAWVQELNTKVTRASEQLTQELGRDPQLAEIANRLKLNESTINQALAARELNCVVSLTPPSENAADSDMSLGDKEQALANKLAALQLPVEDQIVLKEAIGSLKTLEQDVVRLFFYKDLNLSEIARKLNISVNYSSYLLRRSLTKIRTILDEQQTLESAVLADPQDTAPAPRTADLPTYDRFTGLYTGVYLRARLSEEIARSRRYPTNFALMLIDVSGLENTSLESLPTINAIGQILRQNTRLIDLSAYLERGRFTLMLPHTGREARILGQRLGNHIANFLAQPSLPIDGFSLEFGFAVYPKDGATVESLVHHAEASREITFHHNGRVKGKG